jgi:heptosyltransferase-1
MSALGDIIHALPALDFLHRVVPGIEIDGLLKSLSVNCSKRIH